MGIYRLQNVLQHCQRSLHTSGRPALFHNDVRNVTTRISKLSPFDELNEKTHELMNACLIFEKERDRKTPLNCENRRFEIQVDFCRLGNEKRRLDDLCMKEKIFLEKIHGLMKDLFFSSPDSLRRKVNSRKLKEFSYDVSRHIPNISEYKDLTQRTSTLCLQIIDLCGNNPNYFNQISSEKERALAFSNIKSRESLEVEKRNLEKKIEAIGKQIELKLMYIFNFQKID